VSFSKSIKIARVLYVLIIYIKMFETESLTYFYSEPSTGTGKVVLALLYHIIQR
jgi:hypothetical protein